MKRLDALRESPRSRSGRLLRSRKHLRRLLFESLEERVMLDANSSSPLPASIVLGRTLATPATAASATPRPLTSWARCRTDR